ncbi:MAG: glycosyltransferase [Prevotellaceae bacterium]|jgi:glycosyltransferase involved in cell wall biosynthesis|nr:glycosyltransferase [Prevotellaceae bacterium]
MNYKISVVLGSKNRKNLLKATISSIRSNGFDGVIEIIVVDGGSTDGTCSWLAKQKDVFTIIQPNYKITNAAGVRILAHSWGEFMNIGFRYAHAPYIVMVSDDLILAPECLQNGYNEMERRRKEGEKVGGGAFFFREYPRHTYYRVQLLQKEYVLVNHGFFLKEALEGINYLDEINYNFYAGDGDVCMRLNEAGWKTIPLNGCFAEHLCHKPVFNKAKNYLQSHLDDMAFFYKKYPFTIEKTCIKKYEKVKVKTRPFILYGFKNVFYGYLLRYYDKYSKNKNGEKTV